MTIKISDLAKELKLTADEMNAKINELGIETHGGNVSIESAATLRIQTKRTREKMVVKTAPKKVESKPESEPKVQVKVAKVQPTAKTKKAAPAPVVVPPAPAPAPAPAPKPEPKPEPVVVEPAPAPAPVELQENIYFIINKWDIQASEVAKLDEIAAFMAENPETKVQLTGHADKATGTAQRNLFLSEKRAEIVTNELVKRGVDASRISSTFKGDTSNPYATPEENRVTVCFVK